jgi:hypothetical protein
MCANPDQPGIKDDLADWLAVHVLAEYGSAPQMRDDARGPGLVTPLHDDNQQILRSKSPPN